VAAALTAHRLPPSARVDRIRATEEGPILEEEVSDVEQTEGRAARTSTGVDRTDHDTTNARGNSDVYNSI